MDWLRKLFQLYGCRDGGFDGPGRDGCGRSLVRCVFLMVLCAGSVGNVWLISRGWIRITYRCGVVAIVSPLPSPPLPFPCVDCPLTADTKTESISAILLR